MTPDGYHDLNTNGVADDGDTIDFSVILTNTGNVTLTNLGVSDEDGPITFHDLPLASLAPSSQSSTLGTHLIQGGETSLDDEPIGQSDQVGNVTTLVHVDFAGLTAL